MKTFELVFARNASFCLNERPKEFPLFANPGDCITSWRMNCHQIGKPDYNQASASLNFSYDVVQQVLVCGESLFAENDFSFRFFCELGF